MLSLDPPLVSVSAAEVESAVEVGTPVDSPDDDPVADDASVPVASIAGPSAAHAAIAHSQQIDAKRRMPGSVAGTP